MLLSIAWKNVWRNKLRSLIVILSISLGLLGGLFYLAFANGMVQHQIDATIKTQISNIQLHNPKYRLNNEVKYTIDSPDSIIKKIEEINGVRAATSRIKSTAMVSSAITGAGITINGINPVKEKNVTTLYKKIVYGTYLIPGKKYQIFIGQKLADKLNVKVKSKIVIAALDMSGNITYGAFKIVGIFKTESTNFDLSNVFVLKNDLRKLIGFPSEQTTEIAVLLNNNDQTDLIANKIKKIFNRAISEKKLDVETWVEIQPALKLINEMFIEYSMIFLIIILVALSFGIVNTMLMVIMERVRELGMLMAIGMSKLKIFLMIMLETIFLSITGGAAGLFLSWVAITVTHKTGIDLSAVSEGLNALGYSSFVHPMLGFTYYILIGSLVIVTAIMASILPARKALKLNPAEAVRQNV
ncbi:ABC transporter permease YtrF precursor [bacterium BMS3Abin03]|nr:ABC transporter permease YtrF precursor [bacterium BMS3Abin03]GBD89628.1 ABC transporter permease YtrF precursor [bacterium BMS3Abin04]